MAFDSIRNFIVKPNAEIRFKQIHILSLENWQICATDDALEDVDCIRITKQT